MHSSYDLLNFADYQTSANRPILTKAFPLCTMQHQHASAQVTYPAWACCRQFVERLCQMDSRIVHHLTYRIVFFLPSKGQLGECSLIAWSIFYVNEVLLVRDCVILRQLKEANEGLQQRNPGSKQGSA